ncbi:MULTISPECIES: 50S ribosomal protein L11 methyltransferase [Halomonadaceae]|jgi:ribosomal protein L11 methyltransferase|uniref:50S ribosomal protein L11 methyltransferase n=1 Tax=Halomonadaceae TaxID=28256 RepID=UPI00114233F2|nr:MULTISPECIES: 50S ribosomal protein L11 methyltransferase [Halomonas]UEQ06202.1 50S ribosomal protein L11 methyltransferase [Halomonas profundus]CAD5260092.1 methylase for 50S ribosomal subunit protein L11 [Halomonas sp. 156]CAD5288873.1 methylase for 50S ribosomal subunit protein L11 [Halomonas sp. 113]CAD5290272.1 methylase for 50S ribosomal subunit protein L11 [Halomonas sp. 59]CAD5294214.1 methylase for 50S ribosomal subunit protein L11 [Halomonas sp. I3]
MPWLQLKAHVAPEQAEFLEELLLDEGATAIGLQDAHDDPVFEPERGTTPLWEDTILTGLYDDLEGVESMLERIEAAWSEQMPGEPCPTIEYELLADRDWEREWMDDFTPLRMGQRLWIVPSWHEPPEADAVNLILDPGLAFGTGTHPTTALCLEWLDELAVTGHLAQQTVLDVGCGSGILAIAALKLGASHADATDIDPQALQASRDNAERNGIAESDLNLYYPEQLSDGGDYPIVTANILAGPLVELAPMIAGHVAPGGRIALSGVLANQANEVYEAYAAQGIAMDEPVIREGWVRLSGLRPR